MMPLKVADELLLLLLLMVPLPLILMVRALLKAELPVTFKIPPPVKVTLPEILPKLLSVLTDKVPALIVVPPV